MPFVWALGIDEGNVIPLEHRGKSRRFTSRLKQTETSTDDEELSQYMNNLSVVTVRLLCHVVRNIMSRSSIVDHESPMC
jgi:hypothetical protein